MREGCATGMASIPRLIDVAEPREDVLEGTLTDAIFATSLDEVVSGSAPDAYGEPAAFFASTHQSSGLRNMLDETMGRLSGKKPDSATVIRLETNLGGGKRHNLIALWHAALGDLNPGRSTSCPTRSACRRRRSRGPGSLRSKTQVNLPHEIRPALERAMTELCAETSRRYRHETDTDNPPPNEPRLPGNPPTSRPADLQPVGLALRTAALRHGDLDALDRLETTLRHDNTDVAAVLGW